MVISLKNIESTGHTGEPNTIKGGNQRQEIPNGIIVAGSAWEIRQQRIPFHYDILGRILTYWPHKVLPSGVIQDR